MTLGIQNSIIEGLQSNRRRFEHAASDLQRAMTWQDTETAEPLPDPSDAVMRLLTARRGFEACLAVADSTNRMLGRVIDVLA